MRICLMSGQQLESIFITPTTSKPKPKPASKSKKPTLFLKPKKNKNEMTSIKVDYNLKKVT